MLEKSFPLTCLVSYVKVANIHVWLYATLKCGRIYTYFNTLLTKWLKLRESMYEQTLVMSHLHLISNPIAYKGRIYVIGEYIIVMSIHP